MDIALTRIALSVQYSTDYLITSATFCAFKPGTYGDVMNYYVIIGYNSNDRILCLWILFSSHFITGFESALAEDTIVL